MTTIHEFADYLEVSSDNVKICKSKNHYTGIIFHGHQINAVLDDETLDSLYEVLSEFVRKKKELNF